MRTITAAGYTDEYVQAFNDAVAACEQLVEQRTKAPTDDFIGRLIKGREEDSEITDREIIGNIFGLIAGGLDTTANTTTATMLQKSRYPEQFAQIREEPELAEIAVEEALRMHPAGIFTNPRYARVDTELGGTPILKGMTVLMCVTAGNLDPDKYPDPLTFDIRRDPKHILTFGRGPHFCLGAVIARRAASTSLATLMRRFPDFRLADPDFTPTYQGPIWGELDPGPLPMQLN
jgi:cytochrome P450